MSSDAKLAAARNSKKKLWSPKEDALLMDIMSKMDSERMMPAEWREVARQIIGRSGKQCRERWKNHLDPSLSKQPWTEEEDDLITKLRAKLGNQWKAIAAAMPGRSENAIKNRHYSSLRRAQRLQRRVAATRLIRQADSPMATEDTGSVPSVVPPSPPTAAATAPTVPAAAAPAPQVVPAPPLPGVTDTPAAPAAHGGSAAGAAGVAAPVPVPAAAVRVPFGVGVGVQPGAAAPPAAAVPSAYAMMPGMGMGMGVGVGMPFPSGGVAAPMYPAFMGHHYAAPSGAAAAVRAAPPAGVSPVLLSRQGVVPPGPTSSSVAAAATASPVLAPYSGVAQAASTGGGAGAGGVQELQRRMAQDLTLSGRAAPVMGYTPHGMVFAHHPDPAMMAQRSYMMAYQPYLAGAMVQPTMSSTSAATTAPVTMTSSAPLAPTTPAAPAATAMFTPVVDPRTAAMLSSPGYPGTATTVTLPNDGGSDDAPMSKRLRNRDNTGVPTPGSNPHRSRQLQARGLSLPDSSRPAAAATPAAEAALRARGTSTAQRLLQATEEARRPSAMPGRAAFGSRMPPSAPASVPTGGSGGSGSGYSDDPRERDAAPPASAGPPVVVVPEAADEPAAASAAMGLIGLHAVSG